MNKMLLILFGVIFTYCLYGQSNDFSIIYIYRDQDLYSGNKIAKLFINDNLQIGLKGGNYDTLHVKEGCYKLRTNKSKEKYNKCFEADKEYYYKIEYNYLILFGRFKLLEITADFAKQEIKKKGIVKKSLRK